MIKEAKDLTNQALRIFEQLNEDDIELSNYGIGLCKIQASYIEEEYGNMDSDLQITLLEQALENFEIVNHLKGIQVTLKGLISNLPNDISLKER